MTTTGTKPGLSATNASPYTPIGWVNGTPIYPISGARGGGGGIQFAVGPDDADPEFGDEDDADEDDDDEPDDEPEEDPRARRRPAQRRGQQQADDEGDADDDGNWEPPTRQQFDRVQAALKKANSEAARRRTVGKQMERLGITDLDQFLTERGIDPGTGAPYGDDVADPADTDPDDGAADGDMFEEQPAHRRGEARTNDREVIRQVRAAEQRGRQATLNKLTPILAQQAAEAAMRAAGFNGDQDEMDLALRMIDARQVDVEIDDDGFDVVGIDEQVEDIKTRMPRLFGQDEPRQRRRAAAEPVRRRRTGAAAVDGGDRGRQPKKAQTWAEQMAEQLDRVRR